MDARGAIKLMVPGGKRSPSRPLLRSLCISNPDERHWVVLLGWEEGDPLNSEIQLPASLIVQIGELHQIVNAFLFYLRSDLQM